MGLRGPAPKPSALREFEGMPCHRALPKDEPQFDKGEPDYPPGMTAAAKRIWDSRARELAAKNILCLINGPSLARLCENEALLAKLQRGMRSVATAMERKARERLKELVKEWDASSGRPKPKLIDLMPAGDGMSTLLMKSDGRRLRGTINDLESLINVQQREFGLTPSSSTRVNAGPGGEQKVDPLYLAIQ